MSKPRVGMRPLGAVRAVHRPTGSGAKRQLPGVQGSAMQIPPLKEETKKEDREPTPPHQKGHLPLSSSKSDSISSDKRELREAQAQEKKLKQQVASLQSQLEQNKLNLAERDESTSAQKIDLEHQISQVQYYKELYEAEKAAHNKTQKRLSSTEKDLAQKEAHLAKLTEQHKTEISNLKTQHEEAVKTLKTEMDKEIKIRDEKLTRLKNQMAEALKGNSWERQQQLEELTKELTRIQEEADMLRIKLKQSNKGKLQSGGNCSSCEVYSTKLEHANKTLREKDRLIKDLKARAKDIIK